MSPIILEILGVVARVLLSSLTGYLEARHLITAEQSSKFIDEAMHYLVVGAPAILALAWGVWVRYRGKQKLLVALSSDVKMSENQVNAIVKSGAVTPTVTTPKDSIPGVPA